MNSTYFKRRQWDSNSLIDRPQIQVLGSSTFYSKEWNGPRDIGKRGKLLGAVAKQLSAQVHNVIN